MRSLILLAGVTLLLFPNPVRADACGSPPTEVTVEMPSASVKVDHVRDVAAYAAFGAAVGASTGGQGARWVINGLTKSSLSVGFTIEGRAARGCFAPTRVRVTLGVGDPVQVLITDKYAPGTCAYQAILEHEMQHVDILRRGRVIYAERFKQRVIEAAAMGPFPDMAAAQARISGMIDVVSDEMKRALGAANGSIDTAESYLANQARCPSW